MSPSILQQRAASAQSMRIEYEPDSPLLAKPSFRKYRTISFAELPEWAKHNEFILTGYRGELNSWSKCFESVFGYLHNETVNIHTHLHAAIFFAFLLCTLDDNLNARYDMSWADRFIISIFLLSVIFCLSCSAIFHTSQSHSKQVAAKCNAFDYSGIIVHISGAYYPTFYYGFYCESHYSIVYSLLLTFSALASAYTVLNPEYTKPAYRRTRTIVFAALGLVGAVPISHLMLSYGIRTVTRDMGFSWYLAACAMNTTGAIIYTNRVPERLSPGRFDIFFSSHNIMHIFVVLSALSMYVFVLVAFDYRHSLEGMCSA